MKADYTVNISPVDNGFVVSAGCVTLIFTKEQLLLEFGRWVESPREVEREYLKRFRGLTREAEGIGTRLNAEVDRMYAGAVAGGPGVARQTSIGRLDEGLTASEADMERRR